MSINFFFDLHVSCRPGQVTANQVFGIYSQADISTGGQVTKPWKMRTADVLVPCFSEGGAHK